MVSYMRRFTCSHLQDTLFLMAWFVICVALFTASRRFRRPDLSASPLFSLMLVLSLAITTLLSLSILPLVVARFLMGVKVAGTPLIIAES